MTINIWKEWKNLIEAIEHVCVNIKCTASKVALVFIFTMAQLTFVHLVEQLPKWCFAEFCEAKTHFS